MEIRITPAYAGNTMQTIISRRLLQDHPRLRGEHEGTLRVERAVVGSPPPTRGTLTANILMWVEIRITPAYAGNTYRFS